MPATPPELLWTFYFKTKSREKRELKDLQKVQAHFLTTQISVKWQCILQLYSTSKNVNLKINVCNGWTGSLPLACLMWGFPVRLMDKVYFVWSEYFPTCNFCNLRSWICSAKIKDEFQSNVVLYFIRCWYELTNSVDV